MVLEMIICKHVVQECQRHALFFLIFMGPCIVRYGNLIYDQHDATYDLYYY
jgi:hypothetical protein